MLEMCDYYIRAEILLPRGDAVVRGQEVAWSCDASESMMGRAHTKSILDRMDQVEFDVSKVTELTTNIIVESMYAQCNAGGNENLLLDALVYYHKIMRQFP